MITKLDFIAFHEADHAVAHILAIIPFKYVTIKVKTEADEYGNRSMGHIMLNKSKDDTCRNQFSSFNTIRFNELSRDDFTKLAGLVTKKCIIVYPIINQLKKISEPSPGNAYQTQQ
jgi:hypothetical protein